MNPTVPSDEDLLDRARDVAGRAYAPYSSFRVGAALFADDGEVYTGCNVENAAYGSSVCAEVNAITTAVAAGARRIVKIAVLSLDADVCYPCGNCRQTLREFGTGEILIGTTEGHRSHTMDELLVEGFGPEDLGVGAPWDESAP